MPGTKLMADMNRLRKAVTAVRETSVAESAAVVAALPVPTAEALARLHAFHLAELDAIQRLLTSMEVVERLHPELFSLPDR